MGGDFNADRCLERSERVRCRVSPFWHRLTALGYADAVFARHGTSDDALRAQYRKGDRMASRRIDYLFVRGRVIDASHDVDYGTREGEPGFYSDHRLLWALVAG